jgi:hypothetical protein
MGLIVAMAMGALGVGPMEGVRVTYDDDPPRPRKRFTPTPEPRYAPPVPEPLSKRAKRRLRGKRR